MWDVLNTSCLYASGSRTEEVLAVGVLINSTYKGNGDKNGNDNPLSSKPHHWAPLHRQMLEARHFHETTAVYAVERTNFFFWPEKQEGYDIVENLPLPGCTTPHSTKWNEINSESVEKMYSVLGNYLSMQQDDFTQQEVLDQEVQWALKVLQSLQISGKGLFPFFMGSNYFRSLLHHSNKWNTSCNTFK